ncbi:methyltransferase [Nocardia nova]|uniref:methyltransferase n=1 Tax=Nocardia nova TaxID=37330 RepID=UPI0037B6CAAD
MNNPSKAPAALAMLEMIGNGSFAQAIYTAAVLGIADALASGPATAGEIAARIHADEDAVYRLLRLLSSRGVFAADADGRFALNELSDPLRSDAEVSVRPWALFIGSPEHREHWSQLPEAIRTGTAVVPQLRGMSFFEYTRSNPRFGKLFNDAQTSVSEMTLQAVLAAFDFTPYPTVVDVGGGHGRFLGEVLRRTPGSRGVLYDLAAVVEGAPAELDRRGVAARCEVVAGSFFDGVPAGGDLYVLKHVLHNWDDTDTAKILATIRATMPASARLIMIEILLPEGNTPSLGLLTDLNLLTLFGGKERTERQYRDLLSQAGFRVDEVIPTRGSVSILAARPN